MLVYPLKYIFPKRYIVFSGTTNYNYNGNSKYLFEYLSKKSTYDVYWFTRSKIIKEHLRKNNFNYLSYSNPFKLIIISVMTKIIINDGDDYFNIFGLSDTKRTFKISLYHGFGPKITPPPFHKGDLFEPARARPVPFCFQGLRPPPRTSLRVFVEAVY